MRAVQITETGGPDVMRLVDVPVADPDVGEVRITTTAAGVNFIDTYHRSGVYPVELPQIIGGEVAGHVSAVGDGVRGFALGDRVAAVGVSGGYAEECLASAKFTFPVPGSVGLDVAAAVLLQGLTAHYLAYSTYPLSRGDRCLVHAGAGGVGGLLIQMAKRLGVEVFTTVSTREKAELANASGADHVILYNERNFAQAVRQVIGPDEGIDVVYDGVGRDTFDDGLTLLRRRGLMVLFGGASGQVAPLDLQRLNHGGSLFVTRPTLGDHIQPPEGSMRCDDLFSWIVSGDLAVRIGARFELAQAADAHRTLEGRRTAGKVLLTV